MQGFCLQLNNSWTLHLQVLMLLRGPADSTPEPRCLSPGFEFWGIPGPGLQTVVV